MDRMKKLKTKRCPHKISKTEKLKNAMDDANKNWYLVLRKLVEKERSVLYDVQINDICERRQSL